MENLEYKVSWDLSKEFYNSLEDFQIQKDWDQISPLIDIFISKYKGNITSLKPKDYLDFFRSDDEISKIVSKLGLYFLFLTSQNTQNQEALKKQAEFDNFMTHQANKLLFVSQEFKEIGYDKLIELSKEDILKPFSNYFVRKANSIKFLLDEKTEFALNLKENSGASSFQRMYEELTSSFIFKVDLNQEEKILTEDEVRALRMDAKEEVRKEAYRSLNEVYSNNQNQIVLGNSYLAIVKDWTSEMKIRGFESVMSQRNISEQISDKSVNILIEEVKKAYTLYQKYLKLKFTAVNSHLSLDRMAYSNQKDTQKIKIWNLYAPINTTKTDIEFEKALQLYFDTVEKFDPEFHKFSQKMFVEGKVDVFPKVGKKGGAYCAGEKNFSSMVLLNYTGKLRDVSTIAHELGHATHFYFSQNQKDQVFHTGLCLAETASVFNEMLFSEAFFQTLEDKLEKLDFLDSKLQDVFATIFSQILYVSFEKEVHEIISSGRELSYLDLNMLWRKHQKEYFGDMVEFDVDETQASGWSSIPHIFQSPFYCYSYAFGNLLTFSLYEQYLEEGVKFVARYKNILKAGGSKTPYNLLLENGFDIESREFYQKGLKVVAGMVDEFEKAVNS